VRVETTYMLCRRLVGLAMTAEAKAMTSSANCAAKASGLRSGGEVSGSVCGSDWRTCRCSIASRIP